MGNDIVFVTPSLKTGGGNRVFIELANILCEKYNVSILFPYNSTEQNTFFHNEKLKYNRIGRKSSSKVGKILNIFHCIHYINLHLKHDKLIVTDPLFCLFLPFIVNKERIYRFIQADDYRIFDDGAILGKGLILSLYKILCLKSYKLRVNYIFNSQYVYDGFCRDANRYNVPFNKVYPALNHKIFNNLCRKNKDGDGVSVCLVARKHPLKGLQTFINVWNSLSLAVKDKVSSVTLISHDDLSAYHTSGMQIVKPTSDYDIATIYKSSDIFISTSWWEGFGLPPLEAMACGCAVICSKSGGVNEFAKEDENCLMFQPKDEEELKKQFYKLLEDKENRKQLVAHGLNTVENFTWEDSANQLLSIIFNGTVKNICCKVLDK